MKDDKIYNGWNNAHEQQMLKKELKNDILLWEKSGMSKKQNQEMIEFEEQLFKSRRRFYTHNFLLYEEKLIEDSTINKPDYNPIYNFYDFNEYISDERLINAFKKYPTFKDISVSLAQGYDIKSIAKILNKTLTPYILSYLKLEK